MVHAKISAKKFGGSPEDYLAIHDFMDCTKMALADVRHRMVLHNTVGCFIAERVFGHVIVNSEGKAVHVRDVAEAHVIEDLGFIPSLDKCFAGMKIETWMGGKVSKYAEESKPQPVETPTAGGGMVIPTTTVEYPPLTRTIGITGVTGFVDTNLIPRNNIDEMEPTTAVPAKEFFLDGASKAMRHESID